MDEKLTPQQTLDRILVDKRDQRRRLAHLPFEEKILMVLRLQQISRQLKAGAPKVLKP